MALHTLGRAAGDVTRPQAQLDFHPHCGSEAEEIHVGQGQFQCLVSTTGPAMLAASTDTGRGWLLPPPFSHPAQISLEK